MRSGVTRPGEERLRHFECRLSALSIPIAGRLCPKFRKLRTCTVQRIPDRTQASLYARIDVQCRLYLFGSEIDGTGHRQLQSWRSYLQSISTRQRLWNRWLCFPASFRRLRHIRFTSGQRAPVRFVDVQVGRCCGRWLANYIQYVREIRNWLYSVLDLRRLWFA